MSAEPTHSGPHIAILGAGPIGLDAALAALERGWLFTLYESGDDVATHVRGWGHVRMFSPWELDLSTRMRVVLGPESNPRGAAAVPVIAAQECPTGHEYARAALDPIAAHLHTQRPGTLRTRHRVKAVSRAGLLKHEEIGTGRRAERPFRLLVEGPEGGEAVEYADIVLDCTGTWGSPNALGDGGIPAPGESALEGRITRRIPDFDVEREAWAGRSILLVGGGHSAQTAAVGLAELAAQHPGTTVSWIVRDEAPRFDPIPDDPLPARARLNVRAARIATDSSSGVRVRSGRVVDALETVGERVRVTLRHQSGEREVLEVDRIVALTGFVGDAGLYRQLQVHECYATSGPMKLAAALLGSSSVDCLTQESHGVDTLIGPEPGFFLLGAKSYGRNNTFLLKVGFEQVSETFAHLDTALAR